MGLDVGWLEGANEGHELGCPEGLGEIEGVVVG